MHFISRGGWNLPQWQPERNADNVKDLVLQYIESNNVSDLFSEADPHTIWNYCQYWDSAEPDDRHFVRTMMFRHLETKHDFSALETAEEIHHYETLIIRELERRAKMGRQLKHDGELPSKKE